MHDTAPSDDERMEFLNVILVQAEVVVGVVEHLEAFDNVMSSADVVGVLMCDPEKVDRLAR